MRILVTGGLGQLGRSVTSRGRAEGHDVSAFGRDQLDVCDLAHVANRLTEGCPDLVINCAAYTAVDRAESDRARAYAVNRDGTATLARACGARGIRMLHVSTDYVFDGSATRPCREDDPTAPLGVYGDSKAQGEQAVHAAGGTVVRTSWLFAEGGPSFVTTVLRLARERPVLRMVADQHGCPTWASDLAQALIALGRHPQLAPTYHYCGDGETTWHGFASVILDEACRSGLAGRARLEAITSAAYPTPARRPAYAVLDTARIRALGIVPPSWRIGLERVVASDLAGSARAIS